MPWGPRDPVQRAQSACLAQAHCLVPFNHPQTSRAQLLRTHGQTCHQVLVVPGLSPLSIRAVLQTQVAIAIGDTCDPGIGPAWPPRPAPAASGQSVGTGEEARGWLFCGSGDSGARVLVSVLLLPSCVIPQLIPNPRAWRGARRRALGGRDEGHLSVRKHAGGSARTGVQGVLLSLLFDYESSVKEGTQCSVLV